MCLETKAQTNSTLDQVIVSIRNGEEITGRKVIINNLQFSIGSYALNNAAKVQLSKIMEVLATIPTSKLDIEGHTDDQGSYSDNLRLSEQRAKAVYDYLVAQGISSHRISHRGYGESQPIASNATEAGRSQNRRVQLGFKGLDQRTHNIILLNGGSIPVILIIVTDDYIEYRTSGSPTISRMEKSAVKEIRFADGNIQKINTSRNDMGIKSKVKDSDGDGVADDIDKCPYIFGEKEEKGCPSVKDSDRDGVSDDMDECPYEKGVAHLAGCPEKNDFPVEPTPSVNEDWEMYERAVGIRVTKGFGVTYQLARGKNKNRFMEFIGLYFPTPFVKEFQWTFLYGGCTKIKSVEGLYTSYGGGVHFNNEMAFNYMEVGVDGLIRLGYSFQKIPLDVAFDFKPAIEIYETELGVSPHVALNSGYGLSVRYIMRR